MSIELISRQRNWYLPVCLALLSFLITWLWSPGMQATDDLFYAQKANHVIREGFRFTDSSHQIGRIGAYIPLALIFRLFGVSNFSLALLPLLSTAITSLLLYHIATLLYGHKVAVLSQILFIFSPFALTYGGFFVPEPMVCAELSAAALLFLKSIDSEANQFDYKKFMAGMLCGIAYLTSEVGSVMLLVLIIYLLLSRNFKVGIFCLLSGFSIVVALELLFYLKVYGDPLYRFTKLGGQYKYDPNLIDNNSRLLWRLFKAYPGYFIYPQHGLWFYGPLLLMSAAYGLFRFRKNLFLLCWSAAIFIFYNFMTTSLSKYIVLPAALRLIYPACLPLMVMSSMLLLDIWKWSNEKSTVMHVALRIVPVLAIILVITSSLLFCHAKKNAHFSAIVARNAEAAAVPLKNEKSVTVISDGLTLLALSFYREFSPLDKMIDITEFGSVVTTCKNGELNLAMLVVNGLVYGIQRGQEGFFPYNPVQKGGFDLGLLYFTREAFYHKVVAERSFQYLQTAKVLKAVYGVNAYQAENTLFDRGWIYINGSR